MTCREDLTVLSNGNSIVLLSALYESKEPMSLDDMREHVRNGAACLRFMDDAEVDGLVDIRIIKTPRRMYAVTLTDLGREIASFLLPATELVAPGEPLKEKSIALDYADVLLMTLRKGTVLNKNSLMELIPSWRTMTNLMDALENDGLVESTLSFEYKKHWEYNLTPLGKVVANSFQMANDMIVAKRQGKE